MRIRNGDLPDDQLAQLAKRYDMRDYFFDRKRLRALRELHRDKLQTDDNLQLIRCLGQWTHDVTKSDMLLMIQLEQIEIDWKKQQIENLK